MTKRKLVHHLILVCLTIGCLTMKTTKSPAVSTKNEAAPSIQGLTGKVGNVKVAVEAPSKIELLAASHPPADIDMKRMAQWAMSYLIRTPRKELNYEPVFQMFPFRCPPIPEGKDPVVGCDSDARMDWEWYFMRDISGSKKGLDVEAGFHKRMRDYVDKDGIIWCDPGCYNENKTDVKYTKKDYIIHMWGATKILKSQCEDYARTGNPESKELAHRVMMALKGLLVWDDKGRCYSKCGVGALNAKREPVPNPWNPHPLPLVEPLVDYYLVFKDPEALAFAKAYADGIIDNIQPGGLKFQPDGSHLGHSHVTMHAVWGIAHLGLVTGEKKYVDFTKKVWDAFLRKCTGTGWGPAAVDTPCDETCLSSDMMSGAAYIAQNGYPEYFDYLERYMRNRISTAQFIVTPKIEAHYAELNKKCGPEKIKKGIETIKLFQGGFNAGPGLNDQENDALGGGVYANGPEIAMIGCCQPEGMRAIYTTWINTIAKWPKSPLGPAGVYVNLSFNRESPWGRVVSFMPEVGRLTVKAAVSDQFFLRPPHWAPRGEVRAFVGVKSVPVKWQGAYVRFTAKPGDELTITYPLLSFNHQVEGLWKSAPNLRMEFMWLGNMVVDTNPKARKTPLFTGKPRLLPPAP